MADDKSDDVEMDGDEDVMSETSEQIDADPSSTSVPVTENEQGKSEMSISDKEKSRMSIQNKSGMSVHNKSETSVQNKSGMSIQNKSGMSIQNKSGMSVQNKSRSSTPTQSPRSSLPKSGSRKSQVGFDETMQGSSQSITAPQKSKIGLAGELESNTEHPKPEPPRHIEPLGKATEEFLAQNEIKPWILDKMYHEGKMGRYGIASGTSSKLKEGGSTKYEDYKWRLEKMYREVPEDMSVGKVRLKPDELIYEEEKWVLGKMFRDIREEAGYMPTAERDESLIDLCDAVEVCTEFPPEPSVCKLASGTAETDSLMIMDPTDKTERACTSKVKSPKGKVFEFSYGGMMAVSVQSIAQIDKGGSVPPCAEKNTTIPQQLSVTSSKHQGFGINDVSGKVAPVVTSQIGFNKTVIAQAAGPENSCGSSGAAKGACSNKLRCEKRIKAVCDAARKAMAIYDTVTGCDNFPCNEGDKPEKELDNIEDGVWSWLYQLIFKLTPVDMNRNSLLSIPEESTADDSQPPDDM